VPTATPRRSDQIFLRPHRPTPCVRTEAGQRHDGNSRGSEWFSFRSREAMQIDRRSLEERAGGGSRPQDMRVSAIGTARSGGSPTAAVGISTAPHEQVRRCGDGWSGRSRPPPTRSGRRGSALAFRSDGDARSHASIHRFPRGFCDRLPRADTRVDRPWPWTTDVASRTVTTFADVAPPAERRLTASQQSASSPLPSPPGRRRTS
jgi:hypothetical protein